MTDDVNDAAWILVHCAQDLGALPVGRWPEFSVEERIRLRDAAQRYCDVTKRYEVADV